MEYNSRISKRIIALLLLIPLAWLIIGYYLISQRVDTLTNQKYTEISKEMQKELQTLISEKQEAVLLVAMFIATNNQIKQSILSSNTDMKLDIFADSLKKHTSLKNIWFQVGSADGISQYRSWTSKHGDDLSKIRLDVVKMIKEPKTISSISTGKFDLSFKSMVPIYKEDKFIGFIEVIAKFNSIALKMQQRNYKMIAIVDKKYKKQLTHAFTKTFIQDYYIANLNPDPKSFEQIKNKGVKHFISTNEHQVCKKTLQLNTTYHLKDVNGKNMSYFVLFHKLSDINMNEITQTKDSMLLILIIVFAILLFLIYYFYLKKYKNLMLTINTHLENEIHDKTKSLKKQSDELQHIANHDALTGLPNRLLFLDRLHQGIKHAKRNSTNMCVLFLDLDRFKEVNDTYGHDVGDKLLQEVGRKLKHCVREEDTISRLGGDEFTIILDDLGEADIVSTTQKIITLMQNKISIDGTDLFTTFSIGISNYPQDGETTEVLLRNADTAMYKAKEMGKNQYQFYNQEMTNIAIQRSQVELSIRTALENDEFIPYFQPKMNALDEEIIGMEALVRWNHPTRGLLPPSEFIAISEDTSLIIPIDRVMIQKTFQIIKQWTKEGLDFGVVSLNLSIKQLEDKECISVLSDMINKFEINPKIIELEITESQIMRNPEKSIKVLEQIKELGMSISVDDFGTGHSSLAYLKYLPVDKLKIDQSFINNLPKDTDDAAIVRAIISLAKNLNLDVIAEGVETKEQLDFLVFRGCTDIQGYYYSQPLPEDEYKKFLLQYQ